MKSPLLLKMALSWGETLQTSIVGLLVVIAVLAIIAILIIIISKAFEAVERKVTKKQPAVSAAAPTASKTSATPLPDSQSQGKLDLVNVDEPTAAVVMAIVSNESGIPLNRLLFKSIKLVEEK